VLTTVRSRTIAATSTVALLATGIAFTSPAQAAPEGLVVTCDTETTVPGDTITCTATATDGWVWRDGQPESGHVAFYHLPQPIDEIAITGESPNSVSGSFVMPDRDLMQVQMWQYADGGSGSVQQSNIVDITRQAEPDGYDLALSCLPTVAGPGDTITCTATSETGEGSRIFADIDELPGVWEESRAVTDGSWSREVFTVTLPQEEGEYTIKADLYDIFVSSLLDTKTVTVLVDAGADPTPDEQTIVYPPPLLFSLPKAAELPCPDGWTNSWAEWAQGEVCNFTDDFDPNLGTYPVSYTTVQEEAARYDARAASLAQRTATPREGQVVSIDNSNWVTLDTQRVFFRNADDVLLDSRDRDILERVYAVLTNDPTAVASIAVFGDARTQDARWNAIAYRLISRGVEPSQLRRSTGDVNDATSPHRADIAVLNPLSDGVRVDVAG